MAFNVQEFRSQLVGDGARGNLFEVELQFPSAYIPSSALASQKITFMARSAQLPGVTIGTTLVNYMGREIKLPGNKTFQEWSLTIINDEDFEVRKALELWSSAINSHVGNVRNQAAVQQDGGYAVDAFVSQFSKTGSIIKQYKFVGVWPSDIAPIDLEWGDNDSVETYPVTLTYQWWESETTDSDNRTGPTSPDNNLNIR